jgi:hypothetical protein
MASNTISVKVSFVFHPEKFAGSLCKSCNDPIYGDGYLMVLVAEVNEELPRFKDSDIKVCTSCKNSMSND